jgi:hypothetical protein
MKNVLPSHFDRNLLTFVPTDTLKPEIVLRNATVEAWM